MQLYVGLIILLISICIFFVHVESIDVKIQVFIYAVSVFIVKGILKTPQSAGQNSECTTKPIMPSFHNSPYSHKTHVDSLLDWIGYQRLCFLSAFKE